MEISETYNFLKRLKVLDNLIQGARYEAEGLRQRLLPSGISYDGVNVQTSPQNGMERGIIELADVEAKINRLLTQRAVAQNEIVAAITRLSSANEAAVLLGYYVAGKKIQDMAKDMNYSEDNIWMLKRKGVKHLSEMM